MRKTKGREIDRDKERKTNGSKCRRGVDVKEDEKGMKEIEARVAVTAN